MAVGMGAAVPSARRGGITATLPATGSEATKLEAFQSGILPFCEKVRLVLGAQTTRLPP